jgi:hypothetical protein
VMMDGVKTWGWQGPSLRLPSPTDLSSRSHTMAIFQHAQTPLRLGTS